MNIITTVALAVALMAGLSIFSGLVYTWIADPAWNSPLYDYVFPALLGLSNIPVIDTLIDILLWTTVFEITFFTFKLCLRVIHWLQLSGSSFLD